MEKKYKLKTDGQPIAMPCTKEEWEELKPELDKIKGVDCEEITDTFDKEPILVNNYNGKFGKVANVHRYHIHDYGRTYIDTHDKEAFLNSLRGEPIVNEVEEVNAPILISSNKEYLFEYWEDGEKKSRVFKGKKVSSILNSVFNASESYTEFSKHDKFAILNNAEFEKYLEIEHRPKKPVTFTPPYRLGIKQKRAVLDDRGNEVVLFPVGQEIQAQEYVDFLNKKESPFNDEYWEKLYHECAVRLWATAKSGTNAKGVIKDAKVLIEELKNNPLKQK